MNLFSKKPEKTALPNQLPTFTEQPAKLDPSQDPNMIRLYDGFGREFYVTKQTWKENFLPDALEKVKDKPDQLYTELVGAMRDGFAADIISYSEYLRHTDYIPSRGANLLAVVYLELKRFDEAEQVISKYVAEHGEEGYILTNLAKVYSRRGEKERSESTLLHALEIDPNQDNGLIWYGAIQRERSGKAAELEAYRRLSALSGSWCPQLWLARDALEHKDITTAEPLYVEALARIGRPVPVDFLKQMSGDLGNNGYVLELIRLTVPLFDVKAHGLIVANNLFLAYCNLKQFDEAKKLLNLLYAQKRPDWQRTLSNWDTELAKALLAKKTPVPLEQLKVGVLEIEGPLWLRDGSPFANLMPVKPPGAPTIAVFGNMVISPKISMNVALQISDEEGRLSRAIPLFLAEQIHLCTTAVGKALILWAQDMGFGVMGRPSDDKYFIELAGKSKQIIDYIIGITIETSQPVWKLNMRILRTADSQLISETILELLPLEPGPAIYKLSEFIKQLLVEKAGILNIPAPDWYSCPTGKDFSDYVFRLEQQLVIISMHLDNLKGGGISGERDMLDGILQLCVSQPANMTVRMVFAQTLYQMQKVRPDILPEFKEKIELLQHKDPLHGEIGQLINKTISEILS